MQLTYVRTELSERRAQRDARATSVAEPEPEAYAGLLGAPTGVPLFVRTLSLLAEPQPAAGTPASRHGDRSWRDLNHAALSEEIEVAAARSQSQAAAGRDRTAEARDDERGRRPPPTTAGVGRHAQQGEDVPATELAASDELDHEPPEAARPFEVPNPPTWAPVSAQWSAATSLNESHLVFSHDQPAGSVTPTAARAQAQSAYGEIVRIATRLQETFASATNRIAHDVLDQYRVDAEHVVANRDAAVAELAEMSARIEQQIESAATAAHAGIDEAHQQTQADLRRTAARAYGALNRNYTTADAQIDGILGHLVRGHQSAFDEAIASVAGAAQRADTGLTQFAANRAELFKTYEGSPMDRAQNDLRQRRISKLVDNTAQPTGERQQVNCKRDRTVESLTAERDSTVCSLRCEFRGTLDGYKQAIHTQGLAAISRAVRNADKQLSDQTRDTKKALTETRQAALRQARALERAARSRLNGEARSALLGMRQETTQALDGIHGAVLASLAGYPRSAQRLEDTLREAVQRGPAGLDAAARASSASLPGTLERSYVQQLQGSEANQARLKRSAVGHIAQVTIDARTQVDQTTTAAESAAQETTARLRENVATFARSFAGVRRAIAQAGETWSTPFERHFARWISATSHTVAERLFALRTTGQPPPTTQSEGHPPPGAAGTPGAPAATTAPAPHCDCPPPSGQPAQGGPGCESGPGGAAATQTRQAPRGLNSRVADDVAWFGQRAAAGNFFSSRMRQIGEQVATDIRQRSAKIANAFSSYTFFINEAAVTAPMHGLTPFSGPALEDLWQQQQSTVLTSELLRRLGPGDDYHACINYLRGDPVEGARYELRASLGIFNDDETRIEDTMRALSPEQIAALRGRHPSVVAEVRDALDGTDLEVFRALEEANYARADAYRLRDRVDEARRNGDADALHAAVAEYTTRPQPSRYGGDENVSAGQRRANVMRELGSIVSDTDVAVGAEPSQDVRTMSGVDRAVAYVTRDVQVQVGGGAEYPPETITMRLQGANRALAVSLIRHGEGSDEARIDRLGVEAQRSGDPPNPLHVDTALYDERTQPLPDDATPEEREAWQHSRQEAHEQRERVLLGFAHTYGGVDPHDTDVGHARTAAIGVMRTRYGDDHVGAELAAGLLTDERPTARTNALAMRHAMYAHLGTNEELLFRFTERLTRAEVNDMRREFRRQTGDSLDAELGVFGEGGTFTELSGDDRLRMERAMLGVPLNDRDRLVVAAFAIDQQRREAGIVGGWLASGSPGERVMDATMADLEASTGGHIVLDRRGHILQGGTAFNPVTGAYTGAQRDRFVSSANTALEATQAYQASIDAWANLATTGLAILGAIAAAAIGVATGGAALPLMAVALEFGLAAMAANYVIRGGHYGWEQAGLDLAMTGVQVITAGVGAQLGAAAKAASAARAAEAAVQAGTAAANVARNTLAPLARLFTGNQLVDQMIIGALTGSIGGVGQTALNEQTWEHGAGHGIELLLEGGFRSALSGAAAAAVTNRLENLSIRGRSFADRMPHLSSEGGWRRATSNALQRGFFKSAIGAASGATARSVDITFDALTGRYRGDAGDALHAIAEASAHSAFQSFGEGLAETPAQRQYYLLHPEHRPPTFRPEHEAAPPTEHAAAPPHPEQQRAPAPTMARGTAAGVAESEFHGQSTRPGAPDSAHEDTVRGAVRRLINRGDFPEATIPRPRADPNLIVMNVGGQEVNVHIRLSTAPLPPENGISPVASFSRTGSNEYVVEVSSGAQARHVERALAHELTEISAAHGRPTAPDVLVSGRRASVPEGTPNLELLSPHDRGRLAELRVIARELEVVEQRLARRPMRENPRLVAEEHARLRADAEQLVAHLGLGMGTGAADEARLRLAFAALETHPAAQDLLETTAVAAHPAVARAAAIAEQLQQIGTVHEEAVQDMPEAPRMRRRRTDPRPGGTALGANDPSMLGPSIGQDRADALRVTSALRAAARQAFGELLADALIDPSRHTELTLKTLDYLGPHEIEYVIANRRLPPEIGLEFHHLLSVSDHPELAHRGDVGLALPRDVHRQAAHGGETTRSLEAATFIDPGAEGPRGFHREPDLRDVRWARETPTRLEIAEGAMTTAASKEPTHAGRVEADIRTQFRVHSEQLRAQLAEMAELELIPRAQRRRDEVVRRGEERLTRLRTDLAEAQRQGQPTERIEAQIERTEGGMAAARQRLTNLEQQRDWSERMLAAMQQHLATPRAPTPPSEPEGASGAPKPAASTPEPESVTGTASALRETDFRGDVLVQDRQGNFGYTNKEGRPVGDPSSGPPVSGVHVAQAVERITGTDYHGTVALTTHSGKQVTVRFELASDALPPGRDGMSPVARYVGTGDEYLVQVSPGALARHVERALAHELAEIAAGHGRPEPPAPAPGATPVQRPDVLSTGGVPRPVQPNEPPDITPHDHGRLAELRVLGRQIQETTDPGVRQELQDDAERLVSALGLTGKSQAAEGRREVARSVLQATTASSAQPSAQIIAFVNAAIETSDHNPFLMRPSGRPNVDLRRIRASLERIAQIPDEHQRNVWRVELRRFAAQVLVDANAIRTDRAGRLLPSAQRVAAVLNQATSDNEQAPDATPGTLTKPTTTRPPVSVVDLTQSTDPYLRLIYEASTTTAKGVRRSDARRVSPGYEARVDEPATASLPKQGPVPISHVQDEIDGLIACRQREAVLKAEAKEPTTSTPRNEEIDLELARLGGLINRHTMRLGEAAGRQFATSSLPGSLAPQAIGQEGAGVPDLLYREPVSGRFTVIECKGGNAVLGVRDSIDGRFVVEQGSLEYLQSLAHAMTNASNANVRRLGEELRIELAKNPPNVDYYLVQQPVSRTGAGPLPPPTVTKFLLTPREGA